jgi:hypothetical protein
MTSAALSWLEHVPGDPLGWLLDGAEPAVRHVALRDLAGLSADDPELVAARVAAMRSGPIRAILDAQAPAGWWGRPGGGYLPKYTSTVWQVLFLEQLGADPADPRVEAGARYVLDHASVPGAGFGVRFDDHPEPPAPSSVIHCLNGNLLRALLRLGWVADSRVTDAAAWQAAAITGVGEPRFYKSSVPGPGFRCGMNHGEPCAWGAVRALHGLVAVPPARRTAYIQHAIETGVAFLLSRDPSVCDYPTADGTSRPSSSWFHLGFPGGYVCDVLAILEVLAESGAIGDPRVEPAVAWLLAQQTVPGRWPNTYPYTGKMVAGIDKRGAPSRWVTLRACRVLLAAREAGRIERIVPEASGTSPTASASSPEGRRPR